MIKRQKLTLMGCHGRRSEFIPLLFVLSIQILSASVHVIDHFLSTYVALKCSIHSCGPAFFSILSPIEELARCH